MNVFMQGMRRSGTTIVFDILWEDGSFDCYYEPLASAKEETIGGGSGMRSIDFYEKVRECRTLFMKKYPTLEKVDINGFFRNFYQKIKSGRIPRPEKVNLLNYGAPRNPALEFETDLPDYVKQYIRFMTEQSEYTVIKFVRMYSKVHVLSKIDSNAKFIHIVRDPRSVAASFFFGKNQGFRSRFPDEDTFFRGGPEVIIGASRELSEFLLNTPEYAHLRGAKGFLRVMLLWKYMFQKTHADGKALFGDNYFLFRHEDLLSDPEGTIKILYEFLGRPLPEHVISWVKGNVRRNITVYAPESPHWRNAFKKLDMEAELQAAGYEELL